MAINLADEAQLLRPGLAAVFGDYAKYPAQWPEIFETHKSDKSVEIEVEMKFLGLAQLRAEGAATVMNDMGQRIVTNYNHKAVALGFVITRMAMLDNLYKNRFPMMANALKASLAQTKEVLGASVLNNGFNAAFPIGDGQALFSTAHPIDGGTYANTPAVTSDLNEASLEQAIIGVQQFRDQAGLIVMTKPRKLIVGVQNQFVADRLLESAFRVNTANNDINAVYNTASVPMGYRTNQFVTQVSGGNAWYLLTDAQDGFKHYVRETAETDVYADFSTDNLQCKAMERYSFGVSNPRAAWGNHG